MNRSIAFYVSKFTVAALLALALYLAALMAIGAFVPAEYPTAAIGGGLSLLILAAMIPARSAGRHFHAHEGRHARFGEGALLSLLFAVAFIASGAVILAAASVLTGGNPLDHAPWAEVRARPAPEAGTLGLGFAAVVLILWILFWDAIRDRKRRADKAG